VFAAGFAVLALGGSAALVAMALPPLGLAWITVMSSMNAGAQSLLPAWARARGLAFYQLVFMGGQAGGAAAWGIVAQHAGLAVAFAAPAAGLLAGALGGRLLPLRAPDIDLRPSRHWPEPHVEPGASVAAGPVLVLVEYEVPPENAQEFLAAMQPVGRGRRRTGATRWGLYQDTAAPRRFVETWEVATWDEHLRQHAERVTVRDQEFERRAYDLLAPGTTPRVTHLVAPP
jgi:quinol monooxygenase YgiN